MWAIRRLPEDQQWDGERIMKIKGSPNNWKIDAGPEEEMSEDDTEKREG